MVKVFLPTEKVILMDAEEWAELPEDRKLSVDKNGYPLMEVYCPQTRKVEHVHLHRWVLNNPNGKVVDHINRIRHDIRKQNLRICSYSENALNRSPMKRNHLGKSKTSKYKGVILRDSNKYNKPWVAVFQLPNGKTKAKHFAVEREAALYYNEQVKEHYGEFAYLNEVE